MGNNVSFLMDKYDHYLRLANQYEANGNLDLAKRNYYLAAQQLLLASKSSTTELKKARIEKANRLVKYADDLTLENMNTSRAPTNKANGIKNKANSDDDKKIWQCTEAPDVSFDDIIGLDEAKEEIKIAMIYPLMYPEKYKIYQKQSGGGVLLYGPPGTGKTMLAKAVAHEVKAKFYLVRSSDIVSKWVGESEKNIASLFEAVGKDERSIIFIDEMDTLFASRGLDIQNARRVNEFLQQIDGFTGKNPNLLLLGSTNKPWSIDSAALRSGRFSTKIYIRLPNYEERKRMLIKNVSKLPLDSDVDINQLAAITENFSGADMFLLCDKAKERALVASFKGDTIVNITMADFIREADEIRKHIDIKDIKEYEKYAGVDSSQKTLHDVSTQSLNNRVKQDIPLDEELIVKNRELDYSPTNLYQVEFYLSGQHDSIYISVNGQKVATTKDIKNYKSNPFKIEKAGEYQVDVFDKNVVCSFMIKISSPIEENDLGI